MSLWGSDENGNKDHSIEQLAVIMVMKVAAKQQSSGDNMAQAAISSESRSQRLQPCETW